MSSTIKFTKMHGLGNDFVIIDHVTQSFPLYPELFQRIANRRLGIGCDQILLVEPPILPDMDFFFRIFNADGSEAQQCGNGARCFGHFVHNMGLSDKQSLKVGTLGGNIILNLMDNQEVAVEMGVPHLLPADVPILATPKSGIQYALMLPGLPYPKYCDVLSMGNPHCIIPVPNIHQAEVSIMGKALQDRLLFPKGVNVSFVQTLARNHISMRVYERGVGETPACGTAACASVVAGIINRQLSREVKVSLPGGSLTIQWPEDTESVILMGPTHSVFHGYFLLEEMYAFA